MYIISFIFLNERHHIVNSLIKEGIEKRVDENSDNLKKANALGRKITSDIRSNNKYPFQNLIMRLLISIKLKPIFRRNTLRNKEGKERATYNSLLKRNLI